MIKVDTYLNAATNMMNKTPSTIDRTRNNQTSNSILGLGCDSRDLIRSIGKRIIRLMMIVYHYHLRKNSIVIVV